MILSNDVKAYTKLSSKGSILKALHGRKGAGLGLVAFGIILLVITVPIALLILSNAEETGNYLIAIALMLPGIVLIFGGVSLKKKRENSYAAFIQENGGPDERELKQVDHELASANVKIIGYKREGANPNMPFIACFITPHYFVHEDCYVRNIQDIIAVGYTERMGSDGGYTRFGLLVLSQNDDEGYFMTFASSPQSKKQLCMEIADMLCERNPQIVRGEKVLCNNKTYDLLTESKEVLRLYHNGFELKAQD